MGIIRWVGGKGRGLGVASGAENVKNTGTDARRAIGDGGVYGRVEENIFLFLIQVLQLVSPPQQNAVQPILGHLHSMKGKS